MWLGYPEGFADEADMVSADAAAATYDSGAEFYPFLDVAEVGVGWHYAIEVGFCYREVSAGVGIRCKGPLPLRSCGL